jgi:hypothetical protein
MESINPPKDIELTCQKLHSGKIENKGIEYLEKLFMSYNDRIPRGILYLFKPDRILDFNGAEICPQINQSKWENLYDSLYNSISNEGTVSFSSSDLVHRVSKYHEKGQVPIAIADYSYHIIEKNCIDHIKLCVQDNKQFDPFDLITVIKLENALFASSQLKKNYLGFKLEPFTHFGPDVRFIIPSELYLTNNQDQQKTIEINFDDGNGFVVVGLDEEKQVKYEDTVPKNIVLRVRTNDYEKYAKFEFPLEAKTTPPHKYKDIEGIRIIQSIPTHVIYPPSTGTAYIFYGEGNNSKLTKPILFCEGFPGGYDIDYLWNQINQGKLAEEALRKGYDIVVLKFDNGKNYIQTNAGVLIGAIRYVLGESNHAKIAVGGASMGGLVARYALKYMESVLREPHNAEIYYTLDSPIYANVPYAIQHCLHVLNHMGYGGDDMLKSSLEP